jgi:hypothetical protein
MIEACILSADVLNHDVGDVFVYAGVPLIRRAALSDVENLIVKVNLRHLNSNHQVTHYIKASAATCHGESGAHSLSCASLPCDGPLR